MGAQCSGGISAPKLGAQLTIGVGSAYIAQLLELTAMSGFMLAAPLLVIPEIVLSNFCANDPPAYTTLTSAEADAILQLQFTPDFVTGIPKLVQIIQRLVWFDQCYCQTGTLVPNGPTPPPPSGTFLPVPVTNPTPGACAHQNPSVSINPNDNIVADIFGPPTPGAPQWTTMQVHEVMHYDIAGTMQVAWHYRFVVNNNGAAPVVTPTINFTGTAIDQVSLYSIPVGTTDISILYTGSAGTGRVSALWDMNLYCGSGPGQQQPCCPPDPRTQAQFDAIINLLTKVLNQEITPRLPLYTPSTVHSALTGTGAITIGLKSVAARIDVTSDITNWPHNIQEPTYYFSMGFITSLAIDTPIKGWRLVYASQTFPLAAECDQLAYTLPAGITVNITELDEAVQP